MVRAALIALALGGCIKTGAFACADDQQCGAGGRCEDIGFCSFADPGCASGSRFGEAAGSVSNQCVGAAATDGGPDDGPPNDGPQPDTGDGPAAACSSMTVLLGRDVTNGSVTDTVPSTIADAFGYDVPAAATARCAWIFIENVPPGDIRVGVYDHDPTGGGRPDTLITKALIPHPASGNTWVHAPLDAEVTLAAGQIRWLAVITTQGNLTMPIQSTCPSGTYQLHNDTQLAGDLPQQFQVNQTFLTCAAPIFLGP